MKPAKRFINDRRGSVGIWEVAAAIIGIGIVAGVALKFANDAKNTGTNAYQETKAVIDQIDGQSG